MEVVSSGRLGSLGIPSVMAGEEAVIQEEAQLYNTTGIMETQRLSNPIFCTNLIP